MISNVKTPAPSLSVDATDPKRQKLQKACRDFEAIFVTQMLKEMRPEGDDPILGSSHEKKIYESMMDEERAKDMTRNGSPLGVGEALYKELLARLEGTEIPETGTQPATDTVTESYRENSAQPLPLSGEILRKNS